LDAKSKAEETEYDRLWGLERILFAALEADRGSEFSKDNLREEEVPDGEDDMEVRPDMGEEEANDASSRESLGGCEDGVWRFEKPMRDIAEA